MNEMTIDGLTAAELRETDAELAERERENAEWFAAHKPMPFQVPTGVEPLDHAGPEWRRIELGDDPAEAVARDRAIEENRAEARQLANRRRLLKDRLKQAEAEEARAAAPGELEEVLATFPERVEAVQAARAALRGAEGALATDRRRIPKLRELTREETGQGAPGIAPAELRAYWSLVAPRKQDGTLEVMYKNDMTGTTGLHRDRKQELVDLLEPPSEGLVARLRRRVLTALNVTSDQGKGPLPEGVVRSDLDEVRGRLIAAGKLDRLADAHELAVEAVRARYRGPGKKPPSREQAEGWLRKGSDRVAAKLAD